LLLAPALRLGSRLVRTSAEHDKIDYLLPVLFQFGLFLNGKIANC
jgi:hypothetical protein